MVGFQIIPRLHLRNKSSGLIASDSFSLSPEELCLLTHRTITQHIEISLFFTRRNRFWIEQQR
uniref:Uncharacterized protein n=1 Tax=Triticum urartu TaxID=4572 RepID=A0A8R7P8D6_TRIUA